MVRFHEFNPVLYPVKIWIAATENVEVINERFMSFPDEKIIDVDFEKVNAGSIIVVNKETNDIGVLMVFGKKESMSVKLMSHEATHAARDIWTHLGEDPTGYEADAYLVGWIAECCEIVKNEIDG